MSVTINAGGEVDLTFPFVKGTTAVNLTGATAALFSLKVDPAAVDSTALITKTLGSGITIPTPTDGKAIVKLTSADTLAISIQSRSVITPVGTSVIDGSRCFHMGCYVTLASGSVIYSGTQQIIIFGSIERDV